MPTRRRAAYVSSSNCRYTDRARKRRPELQVRCWPILLDHGDDIISYFSRIADCRASPLKSTSCPKSPSRKITRHIHAAARDVACAIARTPAYDQTGAHFERTLPRRVCVASGCVGHVGRRCLRSPQPMQWASRNSVFKIVRRLMPRASPTSQQNRPFADVGALLPAAASLSSAAVVRMNLAADSPAPSRSQAAFCSVPGGAAGPPPLLTLRFQ